MVTPSVFDRSEVKYFHQTDLKACLEIRRPQMISVKITEHIKESADSKRSIAKIFFTKSLFWSFLLNHSELKANIFRCRRECMCNNCVKFQLNLLSRLAVHKEHTDRHFIFINIDKIPVCVCKYVCRFTCV